MTFTNYLASYLEALKISNPKVFLGVQILGIASWVILEFRPELVLDYITAHEISYIKGVLFVIGSQISSSTTNFLSSDHKKVKEIEQNNSGSLEGDSRNV